VGRLSRRRDQLLAEAGELCCVEAIDREGLLVTSEGALVRYLRATPKNPLVMSPAGREQAGHAFGQLVGHLLAGQSLQFYVEAQPVRLEALLEHSRAEAESAIGGLSADPERAEALRRLHAALRESLERHADAQAAVAVSYYVVAPYLPDQRPRVDWRDLLHSRRQALGDRGAGAVAGVPPARGPRVAAPDRHDPRRPGSARSLNAHALRPRGARPDLAAL